jgi:hypothetical protein
MSVEGIKAMLSSCEQVLAETKKERDGLRGDVRRLLEEKEHAHRLNDKLVDEVALLRERNDKLEKLFRKEQESLDVFELLKENKRLKKRVGELEAG